ncbi:hypothetical protein CspHIS471_0107910 [Cutaneotrichosporon sp. HIS471]|nr:hypothetical protein CspHIS471_0107910 [Cutaneotrichosporon sp. HIS471]
MRGHLLSLLLVATVLAQAPEDPISTPELAPDSPSTPSSAAPLQCIGVCMTYYRDWSNCVIIATTSEMLRCLKPFCSEGPRHAALSSCIKCLEDHNGESAQDSINELCAMTNSPSDMAEIAAAESAGMSMAAAATASGGGSANGANPATAPKNMNAGTILAADILPVLAGALVAVVF